MRGTQQVRGARDIKSIHSAGARSVPKVERSPYLELYTLRREKDRLEKEISALGKRRGAAQRLLDTINKRIEKLQKETYEKQEIKTYRNVPTKPVKTMPIKY